MVKKFYMLWGIPGVALAVLFWIIGQIINEAFFGWLNSVIVRILDMPEFSFQQAYPLLTTYFLPAFMALAAFGCVWWAFRLGRNFQQRNVDIVNQEKARSMALGPRERFNIFVEFQNKVHALRKKKHQSASTPDAKTLNRLPIIELRDLAMEKYGWDFQSLHIMDFIHGLAQAGADGALKFWGRLDRNIFEDLIHDERLQEIPKEHWIDFQLRGTEFWQAEKNIEMRSRASNRSEEEGFVDIHVEQGPAIKWLECGADIYKGRNK